MNHCLLCHGKSFLKVKPLGSGTRIAACRTCGFVQVIPHVSARAVARTYQDDWNHFAPYVSQASVHRAYFRRLLRFLETGVLLSAKKMLDVGCATGLFVDEANKHGMQAEGIDISKSAVLHGKQRHVPLFHETSSSWMKKKKHRNYYDVITALSVIEHEADPVRMMRALYTMTAPGGMVVISTPNFNTFYRTLMGKRWIGYQHPEHLWFFTPKTITRLLHNAGFVDIVVRRDFQRSYSVSYAFTRLGDYLPLLGRVFSFFAPLFGVLRIPVLVNPWGDMLVTAGK